MNEAQYPKLDYPELYILDGGYNSFYKSHPQKCLKGYVEMDAKGYEDVCERELDRQRRRGKLNRAATYAFGQTVCEMQDSPTAGARTISFDATMAGVFQSRRDISRRMVSY